MAAMHLINVALQGGGSHGAFTWGVLDALLEQPDIGFEGISGTSAGALNAVALASGWMRAAQAGEDPRAGARASLKALWDDVEVTGSFASMSVQAMRAFAGAIAPGWPAAFPLMQVSALGLNPLRQVLKRHVDFGFVQSCVMPRIHVSATHVRTGRATIFSGAALTVDAVLASACLPMIFPTVTIDGEAYWDGGYSVNPPLAPFIAGTVSRDVLLVQINPVRRDAAPESGPDILDRINELTFNAGLLSQVRAVEHVNQLVKAGALPGTGVREMYLHRIDGGEALQRYPQSSRALADAALLKELFQLGRDAALAWLRKHRRALGRRGTIDFDEYADDTWLSLARARRTPARGPRRLRPLEGAACPTPRRAQAEGLTRALPPARAATRGTP
jgi:NTE family protein